jgi:hypothetical protein
LAKTAITAAVLEVAAYNNRVLVPSIIGGDGDVPSPPLVDGVPPKTRLALAPRHRLSREGAWERLGRTVRIELVGLLLVVGVTALLVNLPPAAEAAGVSGPYSAYVGLGDGDLNLVVDPNRAGNNLIHFYVLTSAGRPARTSGEAVLEMRMPAQDIGPIVRQLVPAGPGHYIHTGPELAIPGEWLITFTQRTSQFDEITVDVPVVVNG